MRSEIVCNIEVDYGRQKQPLDLYANALAKTSKKGKSVEIMSFRKEDLDAARLARFHVALGRKP
ncbi:MAG: hypothetical protein AAFN77_00680 [Planctomycetota bacterium]